MKAISIMFDSLNLRFLEPYGAADSITPNFKRLAEKTVVFDRFYAGSLPCMPARREMHTGRYNFLHRSWGPLEPFDNSMPKILSDNGIYTHFISDHAHYWQDGGLTYHTKFSTHEFIRGQEGDLWKADSCGFERNLDLHRQDKINRTYINNEKDFPLVQCFDSAINFLQNNRAKDNWYLHLECFDPHEPFFAPEKYKKMYTDIPNDFDWPPYKKLNVDDKKHLLQARQNYFALLTMCDKYLGKILDFMDLHKLWQDTLLIVNTDHGYLLGEHDYYAKNYMPTYNEIAHIPFFMWDPKSGIKNERRTELCQTIDIAPTILDFFNITQPEHMQGYSLLEVVAEQKKIREYALFGYFGKHVNITDGRYVYMRSAVQPEMPLNNYTIMPMHIFTPFSLKELQKTSKKLCSNFAFTQGVPVMQIPAETATSPNNSSYWYDKHVEFGNLLFDLQTDKEQNYSLDLHKPENEKIEQKMIMALVELMKWNNAPVEQFTRLGLQK